MSNRAAQPELQAFIREVSNELLKRMGMEARAELAVEDDNQIWVNITSQEAGRLIGRGAHILEALQYMINLLARRRFREDPGVMVDVDGYRARWLTQMARQALDAADLVRTNGRPFTFDPLGSAERRHIHRTLLKFTDLESVSGPPDFRGRKRVTVRLRNAPNPADVAAQDEDLVEEGDGLVE